MKLEDNLPDIDFPSFPISTKDSNIKFSSQGNNIVITWVAEDEQAIIPIWVWENFVRYAIDVDKAKTKYEKLQEAYAVQK